MTKFFLYLLAATLLTSCDNLKKKDKTDSEDDTEETTKKKKKPLDEEEENTDEEEKPKKKKKVSDESDDRVLTNDDEISNGQWDAANRKTFMDNCVGTAEKNVGTERANQYCSCMLEQMQEVFPDPNNVSNMTIPQRDKMAKKCNTQ